MISFAAFYKLILMNMECETSMEVKVMKSMRKICPIVLMIWPYLFVLIALLPEGQTKLMEFFITAYFLLTILIYAFNIWNACTYPYEEAVRKLSAYDMVIKLIHIPFYIVVFLAGVLFVLAMVVPALIFFSPMVVLCLVVIDFLLMITSSVYGINAAIRMVKKGMMSKGGCVLHILLHLIFVTDIISAVCLFVKAKKGK